jgi:Amidohydrolase family
LKAVTLDAAWRCRKEDITGSIEPGKCADFAVLEKDPTAVDPTTIKSIKSWRPGSMRGRLVGIFFPRPEITLPIELKRELYDMLSSAVAQSS